MCEHLWHLWLKLWAGNDLLQHKLLQPDVDVFFAFLKRRTADLW